MPWHIEKRDDEYCVVKDDDGEVEGCHDTRAKAERQRRALYANEGVSAPEVMMLEMENSNNSNTTVGSVKIGNTETAGELTVTMTVNDFMSALTGAYAEADLVEAVEDEAPALAEDEELQGWYGVLGVEGHPTADDRLLITGEIGERDLPLPFNVQIVTDEGHKGSHNAGRIERIEHVPIGEFEHKDEFNLSEVPDEAVVIYAEGVLDGSPASVEAQRLIENGAGVSLDLPPSRLAPIDRETLEEVDPEEVSLDDVLMGVFITGIAGKIGGATVVTLPAFEEARVGLTASGSLRMKPTRQMALTAAAAPVKPPREWFEDPKLMELTPLRIEKDGRVYGHLADWDGCHTGFQGICIPPFRSASDYAYFNVGEIETVEGDLIACGKLMFCMDGNGHAPLDPSMGWQEIAQYYDDATKVGAFVKAGSDRFGTWLAGALRPGLTDIEVQHLRTHPPSGDWRPVKSGPSELIAAFSVPIPGFPIAREDRALVASAGGEITAIITAPLRVDGAIGRKRLIRQRVMLANRVESALGYKPSTRRRIRKKYLAEMQARLTQRDDAA